MSETPRDAARRQAEEALETDCHPYTECMSEGISCHARMAVALRALLDATAPVSGSVSIVRSDDPPAKPLPTCVNCGSNFITPAPAPCDGDDGHYELGLQLAIANAEETDPAWARWAKQLLADAKAYRTLSNIGTGAGLAVRAAMPGGEK